MENTEVVKCMDDIEKLISSKFEITNLKLDNINEHLKKLNGKVARHEKIINETMILRAKNEQKEIDDEKYRKNSCPMNDTISDLVIKQLNQKAIKKWLVSAIGITAIVTTIIVSIMGAIFI